MSMLESPFDVARPKGGAARAACGSIRILVDASGIGGIERHVAVLTDGLRRAGHDARIVLLADYGRNAWIDQLRAANLPYEVVAKGFVGLLRLLRREPTSLLHTHGYKAGILGRLAARAVGVPVVSTFHAGENAPYPVSLYQRVDEWTSCLAQRISVSAPIAKRLPFRSMLVPNFIDAPASAPMTELPDAIGFVGRLSPEKGPDLFCNAASMSDVSARWHIYGDGPMRASLEERHGDIVQFHGMTTDVDQVWPRLGALVISSRAEGLPMVALEAMAAGVPLIAARVGALPEVIEHGVDGWLFEPGDTAEIARLVGEWSSRRRIDGQRCREAAWRKATDTFGLAAGVEKTLAAYRLAGFRG